MAQVAQLAGSPEKCAAWGLTSRRRAPPPSEQQSSRLHAGGANLTLRTPAFCECWLLHAHITRVCIVCDTYLNISSRVS
eukprot:786904-Prorocentrum_minimum.AAC.1